ncbi:MAG: SDR family oxidoreductase [Verrucomicrobiae bacterium]|jgi:NAD(P)-dependent dehydrogenase (short-subunit alcohol dehydrogenase family)|nr:SDR family oxidoreductase [Verrucomicrobiae bacterium]
MTEYSDLEGKVVLITGGANGIGAALVRAFHGQGAVVCFCDVDVAAGKALAEELGAGARFNKVDLLREKQVGRWVESIASEFGALHVLINNAASDPRIPLGKTTVGDWDRLLARNLRSCFLTARAVEPHLKRGSAIINFSSITFHIAPADMTAYVASKGGIIAFTRSLARELGPRGVRVNTISPGWVMTERQKAEFVTAKVKRMLREVQCVPDLLQPEEIARVALFLASEASSAITGQELLADRGWAHS